MNDIEIYENLYKYRQSGIDTVLITIVSAQGSTPRGAGAKMILLADGKTLGTIGGGCVESRVRTAALEVLLESQENQVMTNHLNDKVGVEDGDICGGSVTVLIEYLPSLN